MLLRLAAWLGVLLALLLGPPLLWFLATMVAALIEGACREVESRHNNVHWEKKK